MEDIKEVKLLVGLLKASNKICLNLISNDNVRYKNSKYYQ